MSSRMIKGIRERETADYQHSAFTINKTGYSTAVAWKPDDGRKKRAGQNEILQVFCAPEWPHPYSTLILGVFPLHEMAHVGVSPSRGLKLFGHEIIFEEFQPVWKTYLNVTDRRRRTDRQTIYDCNTALCTKVHRAVKINAKSVGTMQEKLPTTMLNGETPSPNVPGESNYQPEVNSSNVRESWSAWSTWFNQMTRSQRHGTDSTHQRRVDVLHWRWYQHADTVGEITTPRPGRQRHSVVQLENFWCKLKTDE